MNLKEYILTCIGEEGGEISQASSKCLRFGMTDFHPINGMQPNGERLIQEVNDLIAIVELLGECGFVDTSKLNDFGTKQVKKEKFYRYLGYSKSLGTYTEDPVEYVPAKGDSYCKGDKRLNSHCGKCPRCKHYGWDK